MGFRSLPAPLLAKVLGLLTAHLHYKPMSLCPSRLKSGRNFALEPDWAYIRVGLYSGFFGMQKRHLFSTTQYSRIMIVCNALNHETQKPFLSNLWN